MLYWEIATRNWISTSARSTRYSCLVMDLRLRWVRTPDLWKPTPLQRIPLPIQETKSYIGCVTMTVGVDYACSDHWSRIKSVGWISVAKRRWSITLNHYGRPKPLAVLLSLTRTVSTSTSAPAFSLWPLLAAHRGVIYRPIPDFWKAVSGTKRFTVNPPS